MNGANGNGSGPSVQDAVLQTIRTVPDANQTGGMPDFIITSNWRGWLLPPWGRRDRETRLRDYYRHEYNWLVQGAFAGLAKKIASTPYEISGPDEEVQYYQQLFRDAQLGKGWDDFVLRFCLEYLRHDIGVFVEVIGGGHPRGTIFGPAAGIAVLDSMRCYSTGDPTWPAVYYDRHGKRHLLHHTRVLHFLDMPDTDDDYYADIGLCALSRSISIIQREILMGRYIEQSLDDKPAPGIMLARNMTKQARDQAIGNYRAEQRGDERPPWGQTLWFYGIQQEHPIELTPIAFAKPPEKFSFTEYTELNVKALSVALGIDKQEIWELSGSALGTGTQSQVLAAKARGKTEGALRTALERALNGVMSVACEFAFKYQDAQEDLERANIAQAWANVAATVADTMTADERRQMLANQVEGVKDAITDADGTIRRLNDADPKPDETVADDASPIDDGQTTPFEQTTPTAQPEQPAASVEATALDEAETPFTVVKSWYADHAADGETVNDTPFRRVMFKVTARFTQIAGQHYNRLKALVNEAIGGKVGQSAFTQAGQSQIDSAFMAVFLEGMRYGGAGDLTFNDLDAETREALTIETHHEQSYWQNGIAFELYTDLRNNPPQTSAERGEMKGKYHERLKLWAYKLQAIYNMGTLAAMGNQKLKFVGNNGVENCRSCRAAFGQVHYARDWYKSGVIPQSHNLECGGWECVHFFAKTDEPVNGSLARVPLFSHAGASYSPRPRRGGLLTSIAQRLQTFGRGRTGKPLQERGQG